MLKKADIKLLTFIVLNVGLYNGGMNIHDPEHVTSLHAMGMHLSSVLGTRGLILICRNMVSYVVLLRCRSVDVRYGIMILIVLYIN